MNFSEAMEYMLRGCYVKRNSWKYPHTIHFTKSNEWAILYQNGSIAYDYLLDPEDIIANDWEICYDTDSTSTK